MLVVLVERLNAWSWSSIYFDPGIQNPNVDLNQMIPTLNVCFEIMYKYEMLDNIKSHSVVVARVAHLIAKGLMDAGIDISVEKVMAGALLHDIGKTPSLRSGGDHCEIGRQICLQNHLDEIADIVGEHVTLKDYSISGTYSEKGIVYYADKRVNHDSIVSLQERLAYIILRYGRNQEGLCRQIRKNFEFCKLVEKRLFSKLDFSPEALPELLENTSDSLELDQVD